MSPNILVPCPTSFDPAYNQQCWPEFLNAVRQTGGTPVPVALDTTHAQLEQLASNAGGILLPGSGADVAPHRYGHELDPATAPADLLREEMDRALLELAYRRALPTLAVCFGLQSLNVYRGGTLVQDLLPVPVNHRAGRSVVRAHASVVAAASKLGTLLHDANDAETDPQPGFLRVQVNSSHHQAVGAVGDGLRVTARSTEDGVVEALEDAEHPFLIGIQWHPERTLADSDASQRLLRGLMAAAERHLNREGDSRHA